MFNEAGKHPKKDCVLTCSSNMVKKFFFNLLKVIFSVKG